MSIARRDFLKTVGSLSIAGAIISDVHAATSDASSPDSLFGFADDRIPINAANLCPMSNAVGDAVSRFAADLHRDMSSPNRRRIEALKEDARSRISGMLGVSPDEVAIVRNTSEANNTIVQGVPLRHGDEILLWDQNHPSNSVAWDVVAQRSGCTVRRFSIPVDTHSRDEVVDLVANAVGPKTRVVSFTHISNITGFRLPANEVCAAIKRKGDIYVHVDGAQTWGAVDVDLHEMGCDSFSGSAHKWFMGPRETGLLYVSAARVDSVWPNIVSVPWGEEAKTSLVGARKFEALGQRDDAALGGLVATAQMHQSIGPANVEKQSMAISDYLREGLVDLGVPMLSPVNPEFTSSVVILSGSSERVSRMVDEVFRDSGVITAPVNGFRMSPHYYNTTDHVDRVLPSIAKFRDLLSPA
jgi:selenocysteine lyase/cysteine desulfurase